MTGAIKLKQVNDAIKKKFKDKKLVFGVGTVGAPIVLVNETVSSDGSILDAEHAKLIFKLLKSAGIDKKKIYLTAAVKYAPGRDAMPSSKEIKSHAAFLKDEIHSLSPQVVVTLGNVALNGVGLRQPLDNVHGRTFLMGAFELLPTYHPEHAIKDPKVQVLLEADFVKLKELIAKKTKTDTNN